MVCLLCGDCRLVCAIGAALTGILSGAGNALRKSLADLLGIGPG
jgi:hypothetical protein